MRLTRDEEAPLITRGSGVRARELAAVAGGRVERLSVAPGARLALPARTSGEERWLYVLSGRGAARLEGGEADQPLAPGGLLWLGDDAGCVVVNTSAEDLDLVEVRSTLGLLGVESIGQHQVP